MSTARFDYSLTYYISGPMAGYPENNFPAFEDAVHLLDAGGIKVLSPHNVYHEGGDGYGWTSYLRRDLIEMLTACGGIILLQGWPQSRGARLELDIALSLEMPVYYLDLEKGQLHNMNKVITNV